jgi:hypothetical protein
MQWVSHGGVPLTTPITLVAAGSEEPPAGFLPNGYFTVTCVRRS